MRHPPGPAKWLLTHLAPSTPESVLGDLQEEYEAGRSTRWYWRQVLNAIISSTLRALHESPIRAVLAVGLGWGVIWIYFGRLFLPLVYFDEELVARGIIDLREWWPHHTLLPLVISFLGFVTAGWSVGQCYRREMALVFATTVLAWNLAIFTSTLHEYAHDASVAVTMALHYFVFMPVSILIGSFVAWPAQSRRQSKVS